MSQIWKLGNTSNFLTKALNSWFIISKSLSVQTLLYIRLVDDVILRRFCSVILEKNQVAFSKLLCCLQQKLSTSWTEFNCFPYFHVFINSLQISNLVEQTQHCFSSFSIHFQLFFRAFLIPFISSFQFPNSSKAIDCPFQRPGRVHTHLRLITANQNIRHSVTLFSNIWRFSAPKFHVIFSKGQSENQPDGKNRLS